MIASFFIGGSESGCRSTLATTVLAYALLLLLACALDDYSNWVVPLLRVEESVPALAGNTATVEALETNKYAVGVILRR